MVVDGSKIEVPEGLSLPLALAKTGRFFPHLCTHDALGPLQTCDTCWVLVNQKLVRGCLVKTREGLSIETEGMAKAAREEGLYRIIGRHDLYCTICDNNNGDCDVHNTVRDAGIQHPKYPFQPKPYPVDDSNPFYRYDPSQCILCGRCVEACQNVQVNETLTIDWSLPVPRVVWDGGAPIDESSCVSCGHCVTVCPCNALMEKTMIRHAGNFTGMDERLKEPLMDLVKGIEPATGFAPIFLVSEIDAAMRLATIKKTKTVCTYCGVGCSFEIWTKERQILKVQPKTEAPANGISTCIKGKFGWDYVNSDQRLTRPLLRENGRFKAVSWQEAYRFIAHRFLEIRQNNGADALGFIASSKCSNEEAYLMQKLARAAIGTNNIDNCSRYCQNPATEGLFRTVGYGGDSGSYADIMAADLAIIIGSNTAESHPVLATRLKRAQKLHGQKIIVIDPRRHEMASRADLYLKPNPGSDLALLLAISRYLIRNNHIAKDFIEQKTQGFESFVQSLENYDFAFAAQKTGIAQEDMEALARAIANAKNMVILWAMGITQHTHGSDTSTAISNLLLLTGHYGRPGTGAYPLRGHNNVQGASDCGALPNLLPGYQDVADPMVQERFAKSWGVPLPQNPGLNNHQMVDAIHDGKLKSLYVMGEEMALVDANASYVQDAFKKLEFFVVQDLFLSKTAQFADVILPASPSLEKEGTFTNTERRIQRFYAAMPPLAESKPDWLILTELAEALGASWHYRHPGDVMAEMASLTPLFAGVSYARLEHFNSLQWPVAENGQDTPVLFLDGFPFANGRARFYPVHWQEVAEAPDDVYDLSLNNGRLLEHFHEGNMTKKSPGIVAKVPEVFVEISPELAQERGVESGTWVRLISQRGAVKVKALVTDRVRGKELYMPMNDSEQAINLLTGNHTDTATHTPAYKELAVRLEVLPEKGNSPLPKTNPRFGHPTPAKGVEVQKKWAREDYKEPPQPGKL
jgi:formate dehydrogenase major subunit